MLRILSNAPGAFVLQALTDLVQGTETLLLAAPYFDHADPITDAVQRGVAVKLLIGLSTATDPEAIARVRGLRGVAIRYLTHRFHAKIYLADHAALLGSANLTQAGLMANREAVIRLDGQSDGTDIEEVRALFTELWEAAPVLTDDRYAAFRDAWRRTRGRAGPDPDTEIAKAVGRAEPPNVRVESREVNKERLFADALHRQVYEEYRPAFQEIMAVLDAEGLHRPQLADLGPHHAANRFLNWVRLVHAPGDLWHTAPLHGPPDRRAEIVRLGREWVNTADDRVPADYRERLARVRRVFGSRADLDAASAEMIADALLGLHAFSEQLRFVKGGIVNLPRAFWTANKNDQRRVARTLAHLLYGPGDFVARLHDVLYDPALKLGLFGKFCALELYGTIKPETYPPMNGRMAKALRYLGFGV